MKKRIFLLLISLVLFFSCSTQNKPVDSDSSNEKNDNNENNEISEIDDSVTIDDSQINEVSDNVDDVDNVDKNQFLVVYFSCTGTTEKLAKYGAEYLNADIFKIEAEVPYTAEDIAYYTDCRADKEQNDPSARPAIANTVDITKYDTIILGYPIWHGQAPKIISTFLENYDFSGKTIIPFCTSASSGIGSSDTNLHSLCSASTIWKNGKRFSSSTTKEEFCEWLGTN